MKIKTTFTLTLLCAAAFVAGTGCKSTSVNTIVNCTSQLRRAGKGMCLYMKRAGRSPIPVGVSERLAFSAVQALFPGNLNDAGDIV